jgi:dihydroxyacid dehydratase/phosphogluconate dehydratase
MAILLRKEVLQRSLVKKERNLLGPARVFDGEQKLIQGIQSGRVKRVMLL